jgi:cytosolic carboxypeptidase protein 2/3
VIVHSFFPLFLPLTVCLQVKLSEQGVVVPSVRVHFQIVNFTKPDSLFNLGMRPVLYSMSDSVNKGMGWVRGGTDISYCASSLSRVNASAGEGSAVYYTLSFTIEFAQPKDTVFIAYSYPYTLTDYRLDVASILQRPGAESLIRRAKLCSTVGGEDCDLLVITDFSTERERVGNIVLPDSNEVVFAVNEDAVSGGNVSGKAFGNSIKSSAASLKPALFFSGRVHPGETPASWMMKGMLDFLTSTSPGAKLLRQSFVIFVVPILNPDGVLFGNNRCSLAGVDLNRQWKTPSKMMHPTVFALKNFMMAQRKVRDVAMYIDLHGHSRKYNVFMYGCDDKKKPRPQVRGFPRLLSQHPIGGKYLCFEDCSFHVKKGRESTARVVVSKEMNIPYSFTLEATFCGANFGPLKNCHMNTGHLQEMGAALCDAVLQFVVSEGVVRSNVMPMTISAVFGANSLAPSASQSNLLQSSTTSSTASTARGPPSSTSSSVLQTKMVIKEHETSTLVLVNGNSSSRTLAAAQGNDFSSSTSVVIGGGDRGGDGLESTDTAFDGNVVGGVGQPENENDVDVDVDGEDVEEDVDSDSEDEMPTTMGDEEPLLSVREEIVVAEDRGVIPSNEAAKRAMGVAAMDSSTISSMRFNKENNSVATTNTSAVVAAVERHQPLRPMIPKPSREINHRDSDRETDSNTILESLSLRSGAGGQNNEKSSRSSRKANENSSSLDADRYVTFRIVLPGCRCCPLTCCPFTQ